MPLVRPLSVSSTNPYRRAHWARVHSTLSCRLAVLSPRMCAPALWNVDETVPSLLFRSICLPALAIDASASDSSIFGMSPASSLASLNRSLRSDDPLVRNSCRASMGRER